MCIIHGTNKNLGTSRLIVSKYATKNSNMQPKIQTYKTSNADTDILVEQESKILPNTRPDTQISNTMFQLRFLPTVTPP